MRMTSHRTRTSPYPSLTARDDAAHTAQQEELIAAELARITGCAGGGHRSGALGLGEGTGEGALASGFHQGREHRAQILCGVE